MDTEPASPEGSQVAQVDPKIPALADMFSEEPVRASPQMLMPPGGQSPAASSPGTVLSRSRGSSSPQNIDVDPGLDSPPNPLEYEEEEHSPQYLATSAIIADLQLPSIPSLTSASSSSDGQTWMLHLPPQINIDKFPFHPDYYKASVREQQEAEDNEVAGQELGFQKRKDALKLRRMNEVKNTIRWRWAAGSGGVMERQSNARVVRWSDGSASIQIGDEFWDIDLASRPAEKPFGAPETDIKPSTSQQPQQSKGISLLLANDRENSIITSHALLTGEMTLAASSKAQRDHQRFITIAQGSHEAKKSKIERFRDASGLDPEIIRQQREKEMKKKEKGTGGGRKVPTWNIRASTTKKSGGGGGGGGRATRGESMSSEGSFGGEGEYDDEVVGEAKGKKRGLEGEGTGYQNDGFVVDDESGSDDAYSQHKSKKSKKSSSKRPRKDIEYSEDDDSEAEAEESDAEGEEDEESEEEAEVDPLEEAERAVEDAERKRRKEKKEKEREEKSKGRDKEREKKSRDVKGAKSAAYIDDDDDDDKPEAMEVDSDEGIESRAPVLSKRILHFDDDEDDE